MAGRSASVRITLDIEERALAFRIVEQIARGMHKPVHTVYAVLMASDIALEGLDDPRAEYDPVAVRQPS